MASRPLLRLRHIKDSIRSVRELREGRTEDEISNDKHARAAWERFLEIISEASRHLPQDWRESFGPDVPWSKIAGFGNILRHAYEHVDLNILLSIYADDLDPLERAIDAMLAAHGK